MKWLLRLAVRVGAVCPHVLSPTSREWRPATKRGTGSGRFCMSCDKFEILDDAEFYAYFGRMPPYYTRDIKAAAGGG